MQHIILCVLPPERHDDISMSQGMDQELPKVPILSWRSGGTIFSYCLSHLEIRTVYSAPNLEWYLSNVIVVPGL